jgi:carboxymethylenebutenolidase
MEISSRSIKITTADGAMAGHLARPAAAGTYPGVLVIMEAFGLNDHIKHVAERIAAEGYVALAPDRTTSSATISCRMRFA